MVKLFNKRGGGQTQRNTMIRAIIADSNFHANRAVLFSCSGLLIKVVLTGNLKLSKKNVLTTMGHIICVASE